MTFHEAKQVKARIEADVAAKSAVLGAFPTGPMGLTPDHVKGGPAYRWAKRDFDAAFARLRAFNTVFVKAFKREIAAERRFAA